MRPIHFSKSWLIGLGLVFSACEADQRSFKDVAHEQPPEASTGGTEESTESTEPGSPEAGVTSQPEDTDDTETEPVTDSTEESSESEETDSQGSPSETEDVTEEPLTCEEGTMRQGEECVENPEVPAGPCDANPCDNGTCEPQGATYVCACETGYEGERCEVNIDECAPNPCENGTCVDGIGRYECNCGTTGFTGEHCEVEIRNCAQTPCQNGGACTDVGASRVCDCSGTGFQGASCADDIDECADSPCDPLTRCRNTPGAFSCDPCPEGYTGTGLTGCVNVNECLTNNGGCDVLTTCVDTPGSRTCGPCPSGYSGTGATGCINVDDCSPNPCRNGGTCVDGLNSYTCTCVTPWSGSICSNATLTVNASARGYYTNTTWNTSIGTTLAGVHYDIEYRSYFVFPIPSFTGAVDSVTLRLEHELYDSSDAEEWFTIYDVSTPIADLIATDRGDPLTIFHDIGSGTQYGTFILDQYTQNTIRSIVLSGAVAPITNSRGANFAIGVRNQSLETGYSQQARFSFDLDVRTHQLQIVVVP